MNTFSIGDMITFGWETFKKRPWFFVGAVALLFVVQMALQVLSMIPVLGAIVSTVVGIFVGMAVIRFFLHAHDSVADASISAALNTKGFWRYVGAGIMKGVIAGGPAIVAGMILAISFASIYLPAPNTPRPDTGFVVTMIVLLLLALVWALYAGARLAFVQYLVLEAGKGPLEAIKESFRATQFAVGKIILLTLALGLLNVLGAIALLVGLLVTIPVSTLAMAHLYRTLCPTAPVAAAPAPIPPAPATPVYPTPPSLAS